ncbi:RnfH family protein [Buchnera aphidicola]|uniref:UPF0125 protein D9V59_01270 n=1 Tax=Buchnera aphidicola (Artemisaphis artemisicola) TaxID=1241836 RepID=A0A4D6XIE0_9GAMM|nr:RnfH family protein [Buchnera aphidicola]QCI15933.1 RnfH family protein [Buchnera aphidicola (Artemisaphis artemisicola)]
MNNIQVIVVYALPNIQYIYKVKLKLGATVKDAILASNILKKHNNISLYKNSFGIYNKLINLTSYIHDGDRIEIYRNLIIDPKERRRKKLSFLKRNI